MLELLEGLHGTEYLRGAEKDNQECAGLFKEYQKCLNVRAHPLVPEQISHADLPRSP